MIQTGAVESAIRQELARVGSCSIEELNERLPYYSWNEVFSAVDRLKRMGILTLEQSASFHDLLSLVPSERGVNHSELSAACSRVTGHW